MAKQKNKIIIGILLVLSLLFVIGVSYAIWSMRLTQGSSNVVTSGCFQIEFQDNNPITIQKAYPITDEEAKELTPYTFTITNTCKSIVSYQVNLELLDTTTLTKVDIIKTKLNDNIINLTEEKEVEKTLENAITSYQLETGRIEAKETKTFELKMWMDENTPVSEEYMNKVLESKITITVAHQKNMYIEDILNGTDPVLKEGLIPVIIENDGTVYKANTEEKWYSYEEKVWANAVILKDETIEYQNKEIIPESNIESYFVWIPKYRYQLWDLGNYDSLTTINESKIHEIKVIFGDYNTRDEVEGECTTPMESGSVGNCKEKDYMTHPSFLSIPSKGFWVGKFETSKSNNEADNSVNPNGIQIKPNVVSWRNIQVANAFYTTYDYKRELDSHMMKNTEWGAVAYLQHSKYGSATKVRINNNSNFLTGYAAVKEPTCGYTNDNRECNKQGTTPDITQAYNTEIGYTASTTGNISGIYDMNGGSNDYVMGVNTNNEGILLSGNNATFNSGFSGLLANGTTIDTNLLFPAPKYYDKYIYGKNDVGFNKRILGDATGEMGPFQNVTYANETRQISSWYTSHSHFFQNTVPWFIRGISLMDGKSASIFSFSYWYGQLNEYSSFRVILTP